MTLHDREFQGYIPLSFSEREDNEPSTSNRSQNLLSVHAALFGLFLGLIVGAVVDFVLIRLTYEDQVFHQMVGYWLLSAGMAMICGVTYASFTPPNESYDLSQMESQRDPSSAAMLLVAAGFLSLSGYVTLHYPSASWFHGKLTFESILMFMLVSTGLVLTCMIASMHLVTRVCWAKGTLGDSNLIQLCILLGVFCGGFGGALFRVLVHHSAAVTDISRLAAGCVIGALLGMTSALLLTACHRCAQRSHSERFLLDLESLAYAVDGSEGL